MIEDRVFLTRFLAGERDPRSSPHADRVRAIYLLLCAGPYPEALRRLRDALRRIQRRGGEPYHETHALAWVRLVAAHMGDRGESAPWSAFLRDHTELLDPALIARHYTPERLAAQRARREFVLPDRAPLPVRGEATRRAPSAA